MIFLLLNIINQWYEENKYISIYKIKNIKNKNLINKNLEVLLKYK
jgi:hypothetical protein